MHQIRSLRSPDRLRRRFMQALCSQFIQQITKQKAVGVEMKMTEKLISIFTIVLLTGCASNSARFVQDQSLTSQNSAVVYLYRTDTSYHMLNPEKPFFYVNDEYISKLGTGDFFIIKLEPGNHEFSVKESIAFMPGFESGKVVGAFQAGQEYYIRYSKEFSGATIIGSSAFLSDNSVFSESTKQNFINRQ